MAQLIGLIVSDDDGFKKHIGKLLRSGSVPVSVVDDRSQRETLAPDVVRVPCRISRSFSRNGTPVKGPSGSPLSICACAWS